MDLKIFGNKKETKEQEFLSTEIMVKDSLWAEENAPWNMKNTNTTEHLRRLANYNPIASSMIAQESGERSNRQVILNFKEAFTNFGFRYFVDIKGIAKFKYHAGIKTSIFNYNKSSIRGEEIIYIGDIPDFAIDRLEKIKSMSQYHICSDPYSFHGRITIHSMHELPVQRNALKKIDPVIIYWYSPIRLNNGKIEPNNYSGNVGVVIAMWDMDKELEF